MLLYFSPVYKREVEQAEDVSQLVDGIFTDEL